MVNGHFHQDIVTEIRGKVPQSLPDEYSPEYCDDPAPGRNGNSDGCGNSLEQDGCQNISSDEDLAMLIDELIKSVHPCDSNQYW